jgi:hypothetical protein
MPALIALLGYGNAVVRWLSKRSLAELACIALALALAVQTVRLHHAHGELAQTKTDLKGARDQIKAISTARDNQKAVTTKAVEHVKERVRQADDRAKVVEQAPLNGKCETPKEILRSADL